MLKSMSRSVFNLTTVLVFLLVCLAAISAKELEQYDGQIVPKDFIAFGAPQNTFSLPFWGSSSNGIQISTIEKEGKKVKAGDCIAEFLFRMDGARDHLDRQFPQIKANNQSDLLYLEKHIIQVQQQLEAMTIRTQQAKLDLQKKSHLSLIKQKILDCDFNLLAFESEALKHKLKAAKENLEIKKKLFEKKENIWKNYYEIFDSTKARYKIYAPEDGYLFYPTLEHQNRKIRPGDRLNSGVHFLSLVRSEKSELIFYLPEKDFMKVKKGDKVFINSSSETEFSAKVVDISYFPQLIGDVMKNFRLPNAWDKCFIVKAAIQKDLKASNLGNVKVRLAK